MFDRHVECYKVLDLGARKTPLLPVAHPYSASRVAKEETLATIEVGYVFELTGYAEVTYPTTDICMDLKSLTGLWGIRIVEINRE